MSLSTQHALALPNPPCHVLLLLLLLQPAELAQGLQEQPGRARLEGEVQDATQAGGLGELRAQLVGARSEVTQLAAQLQEQGMQLQAHSTQLQEHSTQLQEQAGLVEGHNSALHDHARQLVALQEEAEAAGVRHASLVMQLRGLEHSIEGVADTGALTQAQLQEQVCTRAGHARPPSGGFCRCRS